MTPKEKIFSKNKRGGTKVEVWRGMQNLEMKRSPCVQRARRSNPKRK
jgi:hypothetical protein